MKKALIFFGLLCSTLVYAYPPGANPDYLIVFGSCFEKERIGLKINNVQIFEGYEIASEKENQRGNLSIKQSENGLEIFYNGNHQSISKVDFDYELNIEVTINKKVNKYSVDLRRGKVVVFQNCSEATRKLSVEQIQEQVFLM